MKLSTDEIRMLLAGYTAPLAASVDVLRQRHTDTASAAADLVERVRELSLSPAERRAVSRACRRCLATVAASGEALSATSKALRAITTNPTPRNAATSKRTALQKHAQRGHRNVP